MFELILQDIAAIAGLFVLIVLLLAGVRLLARIAGSRPRPPHNP